MFRELLRGQGTHLVEEVGASNGADLADVVHEAEVALSGAIELTHADLAEAPVELPPNVLTQAVPDTHVHFVLLVILSLCM